MITITLNIELIGVIIAALFFFYMLAILIGNTYVNLSPRAMGKLSMVWFMLGVLTVSVIVGSALFIYFSAFVIFILMLMSIISIRRSNKSRKKTAQLQGGNKT